MNEKALYFSIEAIVSLLAIVAIIQLHSPANESNFNELYQMQKENDLIRAWIIVNERNEEQIVQDFRLLFGEKKGLIEFDGKAIETKPTENYSSSVAVEGVYWENHELKKIRLTVFN